MTRGRIPGFAVLIALVWCPRNASAEGARWIGTWSAAAQPTRPADAQTFRNQSIRLIVHTSAGGKNLRIRLSNVYGDQSVSSARRTLHGGQRERISTRRPSARSHSAARGQQQSVRDRTLKVTR